MQIYAELLTTLPVGGILYWNDEGDWILLDENDSPLGAARGMELAAPLRKAMPADGRTGVERVLYRTAAGPGPIVTELPDVVRGYFDLDRPAAMPAESDRPGPPAEE
jgi:hypothetical protein